MKACTTGGRDVVCPDETKMDVEGGRKEFDREGGVRRDSRGRTSLRDAGPSERKGEKIQNKDGERRPGGVLEVFVGGFLPFFILFSSVCSFVYVPMCRIFPLDSSSSSSSSSSRHLKRSLIIS